MREKNEELEPNAPDWSNEPRSDDLLVKALKERLDLPVSRRWRDDDEQEREQIREMLERLRENGFE